MNAFRKSNIAFFSFVIAIMVLLDCATAHCDEISATPRKPIVLVPPFENQSKQHETINYELGSGKSKRTLRVDRFTQAPRSLFEDALGQIEGVTIVERQRVDSLLVESEFGQMSGLVDSEKAIKLGKLLGANTIIVGTIVALSDEVKTFDGYGVKTASNEVTCQLRIRLLDIESGKVAFSKVAKGTMKYTASSYGATLSSDRNYAAIAAAITSVMEDASFRDAVLGKKPGGADHADGTVEVDFSPKPENCDIEIDGKYVGGSPMKRRLKVGAEYKIRISKGGYKDWIGTVSPESGLRITRELEAAR